MNQINNYDSFEREILVAFGDIMLKYDFKLSFNQNHYELSNGKCVIEFYFDRGDIMGYFVDPLSEYELEKNPIPAVHNFFYPDERVFPEELSTKEQLDNLAVLVTRLDVIIDGDFTWHERFVEDQESKSKLLKYLFNKMEANHPIFVKFENGDPGWETDLVRFLAAKGIVL